jgi:hypothetical protein
MQEYIAHDPILWNFGFGGIDKQSPDESMRQMADLLKLGSAAGAPVAATV